MKTSFQSGSSVLHRLDPMAKLAALAAFCISIFLFDSLCFELACFLGMLLIARLIKARSIWSLATSKYVIFLGSWLVLVQAVFTPAGTPYFVIPLVNVAITDLGIMKGLLIAFRFMDIIVGSGLFVFTTDPAELAYALMRSGIPYRYGFMLVIALRFIPVFQGEFNTVSNAQKARGIDIDKGGVRTLLKSIRYTLVPMIVSALSKADVLAISMEGRAFGYRETRTFSRVRALKMADKAIIVASVAITAILLINLWTGWLPLPHIKA